MFGTHLDSGIHFGRHAHGTYGFGLLERGAQRSASGRGPVDAVAGDVITTNPGEVHDGRPLGGASRRWRMLYVEPPALRALLDVPTDIEFAQPAFRDERGRGALRTLFARLDRWRRGARDDAVAVLACEEALVHAAATLFDAHGAGARPDAADASMQRVRARLADEMLQPPTLAQLAAMAGLGKFQLLRRFEKVYGMPPHAWLRQQRVEHAFGMIRRGAALADAAGAAGFADQPHMTRAFVRYLGFTPGAWRRARAQ